MPDAVRFIGAVDAIKRVGVTLPEVQRSRAAVASVVGAGRACLAAASSVSAASAAIAASVTMAEPPRRRVVTVDCAA